MSSHEVNRELNSHFQILPFHGQVPEGDGGGGQRQDVPHGRSEGRADGGDGLRIVRCISFINSKLLVGKRDSVLYYISFFILSGRY